MSCSGQSTCSSPTARSELDYSFDTLKAKHRELREAWPTAISLRVHRALSWLKRAEQAGEDDDAAFIFYWIAFNAAYAHEVNDADAEPAGERMLFKEFFSQLTGIDEAGRIYDVIWTRFPQEIRLLLENRFVYQPFWKHQNAEPGFEDWEAWFESSKRAVARAISKQDTDKILSILFDRLYVLRNQLIHGGATWNSSVNRQQVHDGAHILASLVPLFIDIMMDNPQEGWGAPYYPVVD